MKIRLRKVAFLGILRQRSTENGSVAFPERVKCLYSGSGNSYIKYSLDVCVE